MPDSKKFEIMYCWSPFAHWLRIHKTLNLVTDDWAEIGFYECNSWSTNKHYSNFYRSNMYQGNVHITIFANFLNNNWNISWTSNTLNTPQYTTYYSIRSKFANLTLWTQHFPFSNPWKTKIHNESPKYNKTLPNLKTI